MDSKVTRIMLASSGRIVKVTRREDDPTVSDIEMADGREMSEAEWDEYCGIVAHGTNDTGL